MVPHTVVTPMSPLRGRGAVMRSPNISKAPGGPTGMGAGHGVVAPGCPRPHPRLLLPQENATCNVWGNTTDYRSTPAEEDLSRTPLLVRVLTGRILAPC